MQAASAEDLSFSQPLRTPARCMAEAAFPDREGRKLFFKNAEPCNADEGIADSGVGALAWALTCGCEAVAI